MLSYKIPLKSNKDKKLSSKITSNTTPIAPGEQITDTEIILGTRPGSVTSSGDTTSTTITSSEEREIVQEEVSKLEETIMKTIENAKEFEEVIPREEVEPHPHYNFDFNNVVHVNEKLEEDKTEFDDIIEEKELRPIVKTILENSEDKDRERDYIVEDVSTGLFTDQTPPSGGDWRVWKQTDVTSTSTSTTSAPVTTYDTIPTTSDQWAPAKTVSTTERGQYERFVTVPVLSITSSNNEPVKVRLNLPLNLLTLSLAWHVDRDFQKRRHPY